MAAPLLFVSHKHADSKIAHVLGTFIEERSNGRVTVVVTNYSLCPKVTIAEITRQ